MQYEQVKEIWLCYNTNSTSSTAMAGRRSGRGPFAITEIRRATAPWQGWWVYRAVWLAYACWTGSLKENGILAPVTWELAEPLVVELEENWVNEIVEKTLL